jgi:hypothetical protein
VCWCTQGVEQRVNAKAIEVQGGLAQLGEHLLCKQGVVGSIPSSSTKQLKSGVNGL